MIRSSVTSQASAGQVRAPRVEGGPDNLCSHTFPAPAAGKAEAIARLPRAQRRKLDLCQGGPEVDALENALRLCPQSSEQTSTPFMTAFDFRCLQCRGPRRDARPATSRWG